MENVSAKCSKIRFAWAPMQRFGLFPGRAVVVPGAREVDLLRSEPHVGRLCSKIYFRYMVVAASCRDLAWFPMAAGSDRSDEILFPEQKHDAWFPRCGGHKPKPEDPLPVKPKVKVGLDQYRRRRRKCRIERSLWNNRKRLHVRWLDGLMWQYGGPGFGTESRRPWTSDPNKSLVLSPSLWWLAFTTAYSLY